MTRWMAIAVFVGAIIVAAALFYAAERLADPAELRTSYATRKEDLEATQLRIERALATLNQTVAQELENQEVLAAKVTELAEKADLPPPVINTTKVVQEPPTIVKVPVTRPTTRAS